jgi:hypothetical protein
MNLTYKDLGKKFKTRLGQTVELETYEGELCAFIIHATNIHGMTESFGVDSDGSAEHSRYDLVERVPEPSEQKTAGGVRRTQLVTVLEEKLCARPGCDGTMVWTGFSTAGATPLYPHRCDKCDVKDRNVQSKYPRTVSLTAEQLEACENSSRTSVDESGSKE